MCDSWAACYISEVAYGTLEQLVNHLEESPLMNLQVNYSPLLRVYYLYMSISSCSLIRTIYLICPSLLCGKYLTVTRLKKFRYGLEYA
jgi:hypothetical protein